MTPDLHRTHRNNYIYIYIYLRDGAASGLASGCASVSRPHFGAFWWFVEEKISGLHSLRRARRFLKHLPFLKGVSWSPRFGVHVFLMDRPDPSKFEVRGMAADISYWMSNWIRHWFGESGCRADRPDASKKLVAEVPKVYANLILCLNLGLPEP